MEILIPVLVFVILSAILGVALGICSKVFYVDTDPRDDTILTMLPGANCGGCGYPGCSGLAKAIVEDGADPSACKPCKAERIEEIRKYYKEHTGPNGEYIEPVVQGNE